MVQDNVHSDDEDGDELELRIKAPVLWMRLETGVKIEDLQEKRFDEALELIKGCFLDVEPTYKSLKVLEDEDSVSEFLNNSRIQMKDKTSLVAVEESSGKIVAVLIQRIVAREAFSRTLSKIKPINGSRYSTIKRFYNTVEKHIDVHKMFSAPEYLKIYSMAVHPNFRGQGLGLKMYEGAVKSAPSFNIEVIVALVTSTNFQNKIIDVLDFEKLNEVCYNKYQEEDGIVFNNMDPANHGTAFLAKKIFV